LEKERCTSPVQKPHLLPESHPSRSTHQASYLEKERYLQASMDTRIVAVFLFLCLSTGYSLKNDDVDNDILDMQQETDNLKEAPEMRKDQLEIRDPNSSSSVSAMYIISGTMFSSSSTSVL